MKFYLLIFLSFTCLKAFSNTVNHTFDATNGFRHVGAVTLVKPNPEGKTKELFNIDNKNIVVKDLLDSLFLLNASKALVVVRGDEVIYERYAIGLSKSITPLGYSMSKSLTAISVGHAICDGYIKSINDVVGKYLPELEGTSWGAATVKDLLIMSSGTQKTSRTGYANNWMSEKLNGLYLGSMDTDLLESIKEFDSKVFYPGDKFAYNNLDTFVLGLLIERSVGVQFPKYFEKKIWYQIGAESAGAWLTNKAGQTATAFGFSAKPHDWVRVGIMVLEETRREQTCISNFMRDLSTPKIKTGYKSSLKSYGYQTWIPSHPGVDFSFLGHLGQYLLFNKSKNIILYHHATSHGSSEARAFKTFEEIIDNIK